MKQPSRLRRISGQAPKIDWRRNPGLAKRTMDEAIRIARRHGVRIPRDVVFFEAEPGELTGSFQDLLSGEGMETARGPTVREDSDGTISWASHYNRFGKVPFLVHPEILTSDEAILAVLTHELFEIQQLRKIFRRSIEGRMSASDYGLQVAPGRPGNFHDRAWDAADAAVLQMRKADR